MEGGAGVAKAMLACREFTEVTRCLWDGLVVQLEYDTACRFLVYGDIKLKGVGEKRKRGCLSVLMRGEAVCPVLR